MELGIGGEKTISIVVVLIIILVGALVGWGTSSVSPAIALTATAGVVVLVATFINIDLAICVLILGMLLSPEIAVAKVPGRTVTIRIEDVLLGIIFIAWLGKVSFQRGIRFLVHTPLNIPILVYFIVFTICTARGIIAEKVGLPQGVLYVFKYTEYLFLYLLVVNNLRSKKQIKFFINIMLITCFIVCLYAISQIGTIDRVTAPFEGESPEPNTLGGYLVLMLALTLGLFIYTPPGPQKFLLGALAVLIIPPFLYTLSRASYTAIIPMYLTLIILSKKKAFLIVTLVVVIVIGLAMMPEVIIERVRYTFIAETHLPEVTIYGVRLGPSATARVLSWKWAFKYWLEQPFLGFGLSSFVFLDSQYISTLVHLGLVGLVAFIWLLVSIYRSGMAVYRKVEDRYFKGLAIGFVAGFIGIIVHAISGNTFILIRVMEPFWFLAAVTMMLPKIEAEEEHQAKLSY